jgi:hypothetical protein
MKQKHKVSSEQCNNATTTTQLTQSNKAYTKQQYPKRQITKKNKHKTERIFIQRRTTQQSQYITEQSFIRTPQKRNNATNAIEQSIHRTTISQTTNNKKNKQKTERSFIQRRTT